MARVGIIADTHFPFTHPMYLRFVQDVFNTWRVNRIVHIGDVVEAHALSFHEHDPNGLSAESEADAASKEIDHWRSVFPSLKVCIGNHDERQFRAARAAGIPDRYIKSYATLFGTPKWKWDFSHVIDGVLYEHGTGTSGKDAAYNRAVQKRTSLVMGHVHAYGGVKWNCNEFDAIFGMNVGCGLDCKSYAANYGRAFAIRPVLGCGVVLDGNRAVFERMACGSGEKYHRKRAGRRCKRAT